MTTTLHITAPVNDVEAFKAGYANHAEMRRTAGVQAEQLRRSVNGDSLVIIDLDFSSVGEAEAFLGHLRDNVWKDNPVLISTPTAAILQPLS